MRIGDRGASVLLVLLLALAAGATTLGGLGLFAETAYAQKAQLCGEEGCSPTGGGSAGSCSASSGGCGCACSTNLTGYMIACTCGTPVCRAYDAYTKQCLSREVTCACSCIDNFQSATCGV